MQLIHAKGDPRQFYSPSGIIVIDLDDNRLAVAKRFGATSTLNSADGTAAQRVMKLTGGRGVDTAIEAVGVPATFDLCEDIVAPGGTLANVGVHGSKVDLHLERLVVAQRDDHGGAGGHGHDSDAAQVRAVQTRRLLAGHACSPPRRSGSASVDAAGSGWQAAGNGVPPVRCLRVRRLPSVRCRTGTGVHAGRSEERLASLLQSTSETTEPGFGNHGRTDRTSSAPISEITSSSCPTQVCPPWSKPMNFAPAIRLAVYCALA